MIYCHQCGSPVAAESRFCGNCGALQGSASAPPPSTAPAFPPSRLQPGELSLRQRYTLLAQGLASAQRHAEAMATFARARQEAGDDPADAELLIGAALAARNASQPEQSVRLLLDAALHDEEPRRQQIVAYLRHALTSSAALASGHWLVDQWWPAYRQRCTSAAQALPAQLLAARAQLLLANHDAAIGLLASAASIDAAAAQAEAGAMLAPDQLPPALATGKADAALIIARIWRAAGQAAVALATVNHAVAHASDVEEAEAPLYALRGELMEELGQRAEAASAYHDAGSRYLWRDDAATAVRLLEHSIELDPGNTDAHWALADSLRMASAAPRLDMADRREKVRRAQEVWSAGAALAPPGPDDAWALAVAAHIAVRRAELAEPPRREEGLWEAAALAERALLLNPDEALRLVNLSEFHRGLFNQQMALAASERARDLSGDGKEALIESLITLTNIGRWTEAQEVLQKLEEQQRDAWSSFVAARLLLYHRRADGALERIDEALSSSPRDVGYLYTRAMVLRALGRRREALAATQAIAEDCYDLDDADNLGYFGWAALESGQRDKALVAFERDLAHASDGFQIASAQRSLALARLATGDVDGARELFALGLRAPMDFEARWLLRLTIDEFDEDAASWDGHDRIAPVLQEFRRQLDALPPPPCATAREELEQALAAGPGADPPWKVIAATAALARLDMEREDFAAAGARYAELLHRWPEHIPEAQRGLDAVLEAQRRTLSVEAYWALREQSPPVPAWQRPLLDGFLEQAFGLAADLGDTAEKALMATPIIVEMDASLVPEGDSNEWPILKRYLPEMRDRIAADRGVKVPGTRLRSNEQGELSPNVFVTSINEVPRRRSRIPADACYVLAGEDILRVRGAAVLETEFDALERRAAAWVRREQAPALRAAGIEVLDDPMAYLVRELEACLRQHLSELMGIDDVVGLLNDWAINSRHAEVLERLQANDEALMALTRVLRRLVREQVPLTDGEAILEVLSGQGLADEGMALRALRRRLCPARAVAEAERVALPEALEAQLTDCLHEPEGHGALCIPLSQFDGISSALNELLDAHPTARALIVQSPRLRPHLRDLIEFDHPEVAVLSVDELGLETAGPVLH